MTHMLEQNLRFNPDSYVEVPDSRNNPSLEKVTVAAVFDSLPCVQKASEAVDGEFLLLQKS